MKIATWKLTLAGLGLALATMLLPGCGDSGESLADVIQQQQQQNVNPRPLPQDDAPVFGYQVVNVYPHQTDAFTQGLLYSNNRLYESTGMVGQSSLREIDLASGQVLRQRNNDPAVFAEGLALRAGRLYQLTLNSGTAFLWDRSNLQLETQIPTPTPAWGLAYLESVDRFAFSDGTSTIRFLVPNSFQESGSITVTDNGQPVDMLNELEFVNGLIYANRFLTDEIVAINPANGTVAFRINLNGIIDKAANGLGLNDVLNGIAFDAHTNRLFVTGKRWPFLYQITIVRP